MSKLQFNNRPCSSCPYRKDCPSGVWHEQEYLKLAEYDKETGEQPTATFLCHDADREQTMCRGWLDTHDKVHLMALRLAMAMRRIEPSIIDLPHSDIPTFASGQEAMIHGLENLEEPSMEATELIRKLKHRHPELKYD